MSLGEQSQKWFPTHVQATVLQAAGLSAKGKNGTNDSYTIIQVGKEKYSTSVAEKTLDPVWREEATFELPGLLVTGNPEVYELVLTVMHRSLVGMDKFLGQTTINLNVHFENRQRNKIDWYPLQSKPGTKSKERGRIQVLIQFVRNNMTASMFDLSMKDKPRSPFFKLKHKIRGRKHDAGFSDTSSAILPRSALADSEQGAQQGTSEVPEATAATAGSEAKVKRPLLSGAHRLSAAQSMSDLMGTNFRPKLNSMNSIEESRGGSSSHRRSTDDHADPFTDVTDGLPQKYATLPRKGNPFDSEVGGQQMWDRPKDKKEKVSLLERVTGKKDGKKSNEGKGGKGGKGGSTGDLHTPNPFTSGTNPFTSNFKPSDRKFSGNEGLQDKKKVVSPVETAAAYRNLTFEEVVQELVKQKEAVKRKDAQIRELEDYIDDLLVRVMEETPSILRTPYEHKKKAGKFGKK